MKEKTLLHEHQKFFTRIDNLLETEVVSNILSPAKEKLMLKLLSPEL